MVSMPIARRPVASRRAVLLGGLAAAAGAVGVAAPASAAPRRDPAKQLMVIGDSWTAGLYAEPSQALGQVAAAALGWDARIDGVSSSGYLNGAGGDATYPHRAESLRRGTVPTVIVVQGGANDQGLDLARLPAAVTRTIDALQRRFAGATILLLGSGPDPWPVDAPQRRVDALIGAAAKKQDVAFVSMLDERWITKDNLDDVIDPATQHPTVQGQRYLGKRLAAAVRALD